MIDFQYPQQYRGKSIENHKWIYGSYIEQEMYLDYRRFFIAPRDNNSLMRLDSENWIQKVIEISEFSLGKYSGKEDSEGTPIYSGDILCRRHPVDEFCCEEEFFAVFFTKDTFFGDGDVLLHENEFCLCKIIGNIYDDYEMFFRIEEAIEAKKESSLSLDDAPNE